MILYFCVFIVGCIFYFIDRNRKDSNLLLALFFFYLALFIGLGDMIGGYDRYIYGEVFDTIADETRGGRNYESLLYLVQGNEYGYLGWQILVSYITANRYIFILLTTVMVYLLYYVSFRKYITHYPIAAIVFLGILYYFTMTYLRQVLAVGIIWIGVRYIWERKPIKFFIFVLLAYSFHSSALIFVPMYFVPIKKFSEGQVLFFIFACLILGLTSVPSTLMSVIGEATSMALRTGEYVEQDQGFRIEYLGEALVFVWLMFRNYPKIDTSKRTLVFMNMTFMFCGILLIFMRFGQGGRLGWFYLIGLIYMLQYLCYVKSPFKWMKPLVIIMSFLLFLRITIVWGPMHSPYKTFLTNGAPNGNTYEANEYDFNYTMDKFYR